MKLEKDLALQFKERLGIYISARMIGWGGRLNSGSPYIPGKGKICMWPPGTFDWVTIFMTQDGLLCVFWELKSDSEYDKFWASKGKREIKQKEFHVKYNSIPGFKAFVIKDIKVFDNFINQNAIDKISEIKL